MPAFSPDDVGVKVSPVTSSQPQSPASSARPSPVSSSSDWYLNKRNSQGSRSPSRSNSNCSNDSAQPGPSTTSKKAATPLPPSMEVSLAILTSGLSVAAIHLVKGISEKRAAKKLAKAKSQQDELSRSRSLAVPSSIPDQSPSVISELPDTSIAPERSPSELSASEPHDLPPAYSVASDSSSAPHDTYVVDKHAYGEASRGS